MSDALANALDALENTNRELIRAQTALSRIGTLAAWGDDYSSRDLPRRMARVRDILAEYGAGLDGNGSQA